MRTVSGEWKWLYCSGRVTQRADDGRALRMTGTLVDIDARKRAEQASRDAEERYRTLVELAPNGVVVESGGIIEYANTAAARHAGRGLAEGAARHAVRGVHPSGAPRALRRAHGLPARRARARRRSRSARLRRLDGGETVVETASVSYLERGRLVQQTMLRDVSEQRKAREALAERERRFRDVLEASGEYVWETDAAWRYTFLSERVEAVLGYLRHEMIGRTPREFMPLGEARAIEEWFARHAAEGDGLPRPGAPLDHQVRARDLAVGQRRAGVRRRGQAGRLPRHRRRRHRAQAGGGAHPVPRHARCADRPAEPRAARRPRRPGDPRRGAQPRQPRAAATSTSTASSWSTIRSATRPATRCCARWPSACGATLRRDDTLARLGGDEFALLWNGLKGARRRGDAGAARAVDPRAPVHDRGPHAQRDRLDRHRRVPGRRARLRRAAEERRRGEEPRQGDRAQQLPLLLAGAERARAGAPRHGERPAPRARAQRAACCTGSRWFACGADGRRGGRRRGAGALAPPARRAADARTASSRWPRTAA